MHSGAAQSTATDRAGLALAQFARHVYEAVQSRSSTRNESLAAILDAALHNSSSLLETHALAIANIASAPARRALIAMAVYEPESQQCVTHVNEALLDAADCSE